MALIHHADQSVLAVALDHGFMSAAGFARAFRAHFGTTATAWRAKGTRRRRKGGKAIRKARKARPRARAQASPMRVVVQELPAYTTWENVMTPAMRPRRQTWRAP